MKTSYFSKYKAANGVSIARGTPRWFQGRAYAPLMPTWDMINDYKQSKDEARYTKRYEGEILANLDPTKVYEELGEDAVLLCHCGEGFCHRHLVAGWLNKHLSVDIKEYKQVDWRELR